MKSICRCIFRINFDNLDCTTIGFANNTLINSTNNKPDVLETDSSCNVDEAVVRTESVNSEQYAAYEYPADFLTASVSVVVQVVIDGQPVTVISYHVADAA